MRNLTADEKRTIVLQAMKCGSTFQAAYAKAGLSDYGANRAKYLERLIENGYVKLAVTDKQ